MARLHPGQLVIMAQVVVPLAAVELDRVVAQAQYIATNGH